MVDALRQAEGKASDLIKQNLNIQEVLKNSRNESLVGTIIGASDAKRGDLIQLAQMRRTLPPEVFDQVAGTALSEMGHNTATGKFSLNQFATRWGQMNERAKAVMFPDKAHRSFLDQIANLGRQLRGGDQYANASQTGRAVALGGMVNAVGGAGLAAMLGNPGALLPVLGSIGGGYALGTMLARPAGAATVARWARAAQAYNRAPSTATRASLVVAGRSLIGALQDGQQQQARP